MQLKPLAGMRVLDFTIMPPGGFCTVILADLGADIIRVEPPAQKGRPSLVIGQPALSRGKRSLSLDIRNPAANDILRRLAETTDIVVENSKPGSMEARGFGYAQARTANPKIVWCAITGFGQTGPYADWPGHDLTYLAHSGLLHALNGQLPWQPEISLSLQAGALAAVTGIQAALLQRVATGEGVFLDISLSEAAGWLLTCGINPLSESPYAIPATPDRRLYRCADGRFVAVASGERRTWDALCDGLGLPELKDTLGKPAEFARAAAALEDIFATRPAAAWVAELGAAGAAVIAVNHGAQIAADPQVQARAAVADCAGTPVPANPVRTFAAGASQAHTATAKPGLVGADTENILTTAGFSANDLKNFTDAGLI